MTEALAAEAPPRPPPARRELGPLAFVRAARSNTLDLWSEGAYEDEAQVARFLGRTRALLNAPEAIRHVLVDNAANYRRSPASIRVLHPITGRGLLLSEGDAWRLQRRTVAPALAPRSLPVLAQHIAAAAIECVAALHAELCQVAPGPVDLLLAMQRLALDVAGRSMFSMRMSDTGTAMRALLDEFAARHAQPYLLDLLLPARLMAPRDFGRRRFRAKWTRYIDGLIATRLAAPAPETPRDLLDLLRDARDPDTGAGFSPAELRDQVATMIVAGHETTAMALFWSATLLAGDEGAQARVAAETRGLDLSPDRVAASLPQLVFTRAVVNETLRLYPPAPIMARQAIGPDQVTAGVALPRGALAIIAPWVLHRHRRFWRAPDVFDPSRFLPDAEPPEKFSYLPFGAGPRVCVGAQFALAEATIGLASLVQAFEITKVSPAPVMPVAVVTLRPDHAPSFRLMPRR